jgi:two-component system chemotaxis response regulator CheY
MRALVIDDSRTVRTIIRTILCEAGMEVLEASHGKEGLEQMRRNPDVELILVDWNMPVMDGMEFILAVRADPAYNAARILMVTTESECDHVMQALDAGANEYLMKPFTREVLMAKLTLMDVFGA